MRRRKSTSGYATRKRAPASWWRFVKSQPCSVAMAYRITDFPWVETACWGPIEADHEGAGHGLQRKSKDRDAGSICKGHHIERTDQSTNGAFTNFKQADMRAFNRWSIERTHRHARLADVAIPDV